MLNSSPINNGSQPANNNNTLTVLDAVPVPECAGPCRPAEPPRQLLAPRLAGIRNSIPNLRHEEAGEIEVVRKIASAKELAKSAREDNVLHRNDLPPREEMPFCPPGPTFGEMLEREMSRRGLNVKTAARGPVQRRSTGV
ncbi:MAG TPA: hypothetical protein VG146_20720 [Verrucomicrobiae bacterium]|nr:hypothetical protein [Verrucomicrobiae bacterium]